MHSGIRGGPHVGAFRRCSFANAESYSKRNLRASPVIHLLVSIPTGPYGEPIPSVLQVALPECSGTPYKTHTLANNRRWEPEFQQQLPKRTKRGRKEVMLR